MANHPELGRVIQNSCYDEECRDTRRCLQRDVTRGIYTHNEARATFERLVRRKKRLYLAKFEDHLYRLFLGRESKRAWKMFNERQPTTQLTSPQVWHEYAKVLYDIPGQPHLPHLNSSHPHESIFLTPQNVRNAIDRLQFGKAQDHDGLVGDTLSMPVTPCSHC